MDRAPLLLIDDDDELCELLAEYLGREGFRIEVAHDGERGLARACSGEHALVVLDVMLPGANGLDVLRALRARSAVPVLMLTARGDDVDRIVGLELGADDYLAKPFNPRELAARIRAVQRRTLAARPRHVSETLAIDDVSVQLDARVVRVGGREVALTSAELALLELLLRSAGRAVSRDELSERVLGRAFSPLDRSIDVHASNLRRKLGPSAAGRDRIRAVRGEGYAYVPDPRT